MKRVFFFFKKVSESVTGHVQAKAGWSFIRSQNVWIRGKSVYIFTWPLRLFPMQTAFLGWARKSVNKQLCGRLNKRMNLSVCTVKSRRGKLQPMYQKGGEVGMRAPFLSSTSLPVFGPAIHFPFPSLSENLFCKDESQHKLKLLPHHLIPH